MTDSRKNKSVIISVLVRITSMFSITVTAVSYSKLASDKVR